MGKRIAIFITFAVGMFMLLEYFIVSTRTAALATEIRTGGIVIMAFTYILGLVNLVQVNYAQVHKRHAGYFYKIVLLGGVLTMLIAGKVWSHAPGESVQFTWLYDHLFSPLQATMFSLLSFFMASAAFRAFRARSWEAGLLLFAAILVMIGRVPIGQLMWDGFPEVQQWIMSVPNLAGRRALFIGAALGGISAGLRVILGIERNYMSQG